jgi:hypothetical protein
LQKFPKKDTFLEVDGPTEFFEAFIVEEKRIVALKIAQKGKNAICLYERLARKKQIVAVMQIILRATLQE